ncbi:MAG: endolytic transglycosylase MltG [Flavitalea sp.]
MIKRLILGVVILLLVTAAIAGRFFLSNTPFSEKTKFLYIHTGHATKDEVMKTVEEEKLVSNPISFCFLARQMGVWEKIRPGRYQVNNGMSLLDIARMLRNSKQSPVNLVITKIRTKEQLASIIGKKFECDSALIISYINNLDTLKQYELDSATVMTAIFPNTYTYLWTTPPAGIFKKLFAEYRKVWTDERKQKADSLGLNPTTAYILASIIEEETNYDAEKGNIASVYLNRLQRNMNLGADPTVKFALRDFALTRIYEKHLAFESPYNTYRNKGLPPGPICTPSLKTLDAVLNSPRTNYLFFVASKDFTQKHVFTETYADHLKYAKEYQQALTRLQQHKQHSVAEDTGNQQ